MKSEIASSPLPIFRNDSVNEEKSAASIPPGRLSFAVTRRGGKSDRGEFGQRHSWPVKWRVVVEVRLRATSTEEEEEEEEPGGRWEKRDVGGHTRSFPAASELCAPGKGCLAAAGGCNPGLFIRRKRRAKETREWRNAKQADGAFTVLRPVRAITSRAASRRENVTSRACFTRKGGWKRWFRPNENCRKGGVGFGFVLRVDTWIYTYFRIFPIPSLHTLNLFIESVTY